MIGYTPKQLLFFRIKPIILVGLSSLLYIALFTIVVPHLQEPTGILVLLPIILGSWFWGMRIAILLAISGGILNYILYLPTGLLEESNWIILIPNAVILLVAGLVGYSQDLRRQLKQQNHLINISAQHDSLTGLLNRHAFKYKAQDLLESSKLNKTLLAFCYIDLDGFKLINDSYGHAAGDFLLIEVAKRLSEYGRNSDLKVRLGGDEFLLIFPDLKEPTHAKIIAEKILNGISKPYCFKNLELIIKASIGISIFPQNGSSLEDLVKAADLAMYEVKHQGRNGIKMNEFSSPPTLKVSSDLTEKYSN